VIGCASNGFGAPNRVFSHLTRPVNETRSPGIWNPWAPGRIQKRFAILAAILDNNYGSWGRKRWVSEIRVSILSHMATPALASDEMDVLSRMQQTIDAANRNIDAAVAGNFMPSVVLVDDLAPYVFRGPAADAILEWSNAYGADSAKNSITDFSMKLLKPRRVKVSGDRAYIVLPAVYSFKQRLKPMQKRGTITATLERVDKKWLIATWSWAGQ
jgi:hypothetical protein